MPPKSSAQAQARARHKALRADCAHLVYISHPYTPTGSRFAGVRWVSDADSEDEDPAPSGSWHVNVRPLKLFTAFATRELAEALVSAALEARECPPRLLWRSGFAETVGASAESGSDESVSSSDDAAEAWGADATAGRRGERRTCVSPSRSQQWRGGRWAW